jgi:transposase
MTANRTPDDVLAAAVAAYEAAGRSQTAAALAVGVSRETMQRRLRYAAERGLMGLAPVMEGYAIKSVASRQDGAWVKQTKQAGDVFALPSGQEVKGVSALLDPDKRVVMEWVKTGPAAPHAVDIAETLKAAFADYQPAAAVSVAPAAANDNLLTLIPCNDWHIGMFAWERETDTNWDLKIAEAKIGAGIEDAIGRSPPSATAIVLGGGDLTHADNNQNRTTKSANQLDVDGRHQKVIETAGALMVRAIDAALRRHGRVIVRNLKGNHDTETAPAIAWFLHAWYRFDPRVTVDLDQSIFFYHQFGKVMLAATHGHEAKLVDLPQIMAHRRAAMWGATLFRYGHGFHVHHKSKLGDEIGGVSLESHQAPIPPDSWHYGAGYLSGRSLQTITYHRDFGEHSRVRVAMLDADNDNRRQEAAA